MSTPRVQLGLYWIAQGLCSWCKGSRSLKLGAFPALDRDVTGHTHVWWTWRVHTRTRCKCVHHCARLLTGAPCDVILLAMSMRCCGKCRWQRTASSSRQHFRAEVPVRGPSGCTLLTWGPSGCTLLTFSSPYGHISFIWKTWSIYTYIPTYINSQIHLMIHNHIL